MSWKRWVLISAAGVLALFLGAGVSLLFPPRKTHDVAVPPNDATPEQVVRAYLDALNAHDCDTAVALSVDNGADESRSWCNDVAHLTAATVRHPVRVNPATAGLAASDQVVLVPVDFDLRWRLGRSDGTMDNGPTVWGYELVRHPDGGPWRIVDQGVG